MFQCNVYVCFKLKYSHNVSGKMMQMSREIGNDMKEFNLSLLVLIIL